MEYLKVLRPDHWLKNIFIFFGHLVAVALLDTPITGGLIVAVLLSFIPACLIASANYVINEILDAPFDRLHPTKKLRPVAAGTVKESILWVIMAGLVAAGFAMSLWLFHLGYTISLGLLLLSGLVYNVQPFRLKDRAFLDVLAESFNNPIRLWLGWYAVAPALSFPPLSVLLAWWSFGGLLMTGKRYAEFRFIADEKRSGEYRKSFKVYRNRTLIMQMLAYSLFFCFCTGVAIAVYRPNLVFVFPMVVIAVMVYFDHAMTTEGARLEPEQLIRHPAVLGCTLATVVAGIFLAWIKTDLTKLFHFFELIGGQ